MTNTQDMTLEQRIALDYADAWRPNEGDSIIGFITEVSVGESDWGQYPIVTVTGKDGKRASIHAFHSVLQDGLIDAAPSIGEEIAVKYNGLRLPKHTSWDDKKQVNQDGGKKDPRYHDYRVIVNRAPEDIWGKMKKATKRTDGDD